MAQSGPALRIAILLVLSIGAYTPALWLPFIGDDYGQIPIARNAAAAGFEPLLHNTSLRTRATYIFLSAAVDHVFGFEPAPFYVASILLHALCVLMLYGLDLATGRQIYDLLGRVFLRHPRGASGSGHVARRVL